VMATRYFISANESQKINNAVSQIHGIAGGAANYNVANHSYTGLSIKGLVDGKYIPAALGGGSAGTGEGANPWGGNLMVDEATTGGGYTITLSAVPATSCTKLESMLKGAENESASCTGTDLVVTFH
jgi:hypothetical protein